MLSRSMLHLVQMVVLHYGGLKVFMEPYLTRIRLKQQVQKAFGACALHAVLKHGLDNLTGRRFKRNASSFANALRDQKYHLHLLFQSYPIK